MTADRCPTCDNPIATDADYAEAERLTDEHGHDHAVQHFSGALCWSRFGQPCEPHDWRAECLRLRVPRDVRPHPDALVLPEEMHGVSLSAVWRAAFTAGFDSGQDTGYAQGHAALADRLSRSHATTLQAEQRALATEADAATMRRERDAALEQAAHAEAECAGLRLHIQRFSLPDPSGSALAVALVQTREWCETQNLAAIAARDSVGPNAQGSLGKRRARHDAQAQVYRTIRDRLQEIETKIGGGQ